MKGILYPDIAFKMTISLVISDQPSMKLASLPATLTSSKDGVERSSSGNSIGVSSVEMGPLSSDETSV